MGNLGSAGRYTGKYTRQGRISERYKLYNYKGMIMEILETEHYRGYNINIVQDFCVEDPREWECNISTLALGHRRHGLPDETGLPKGWMESGRGGVYTPEEVVAIKYKELANTVKPGEDLELYQQGWADVRDRILLEFPDTFWIAEVSMYDHSGISLYIGTGSGWDSGGVGYIFLTESQVLKVTGHNHLTDELQEKAVGWAEEELETYNDYVKGEVFGFVIEPGEEGLPEVPDNSCYGYYGMNWEENGLIAEAHSNIDHTLWKLRKKKEKKLKAYIKYSVPLEKRWTEPEFLTV